MTETSDRRDRLGKSVRQELSARFGERFSEEQTVRLRHCQATGWISAQPPDGVVFAQTGAEVEFLLGLCSEYGVPAIPFGAGTSLEGQVNAPYGGLAIAMSGMRDIVRTMDDDLAVSVQPGVTRSQLNDYVGKSGLFFSVDPGATATLGGMASTRASGTTTVRYGTMRENVLALDVVLASGRAARLGSLARKSAAGYDLCHLFVGGEGTLGVITELTVRLHAIPRSIAVGICSFNTITAAVGAVVRTLQYGLRPARIELLDISSVRATNAYAGLRLAERPHLFLELHGSQQSVSQQARTLTEIIQDAGAREPEFSASPSRREILWQARHDAWWALHAANAGMVGLPTDVCVPLSMLSKCIEETESDLSAMDLNAPLIGHVGDGNFHLLIFASPTDKDAMGRAEEFVGRLNERAIRMGGTCTGEHGVGQGKARFMAAQHGVSLEIMRTIRDALDPSGIMNPGKIFGGD